MQSQNIIFILIIFYCSIGRREPLLPRLPGIHAQVISGWRFEMKLQVKRKKKKKKKKIKEILMIVMLIFILSFLF